MRTENEIRSRIQLAIIEEINKQDFSEPENTIPAFVQKLTEKITEITLDEILFRKRF
jgi:hypothetical protein